MKTPWKAHTLPTVNVGERVVVSVARLVRFGFRLT